MLEEFGYHNKTSGISFLYSKNDLSCYIYNDVCSISDSFTSPRITILLVQKINDKYFSLLNDFVIDFAKELSDLRTSLEPVIHVYNREGIKTGSFDGYVYKIESKKIRIRYVIDFERLEYNIETIPLIQK